MAIDIDDLTTQELENLLKEKKRREANKLAEEGAKIREELAAYCLKKYKLPLATIFTAGKRTEYKHPETGEVWKAGGAKNKKPEWVKVLQKADKKAA